METRTVLSLHRPDAPDAREPRRVPWRPAARLAVALVLLLEAAALLAKLWPRAG